MSNRSAVLDTANEIVHKDRNVSYGDPEDNFSRTADLINAQFRQMFKYNVEFSAHDVAIIQILLKVARLYGAKSDENPMFDSWVDIAGYAACGYDTVAAPQEEMSADDLVRLLGLDRDVINVPVNQCKSTVGTSPSFIICGPDEIDEFCDVDAYEDDISGVNDPEPELVLGFHDRDGDLWEMLAGSTNLYFIERGSFNSDYEYPESFWDVNDKWGPLVVVATHV